MGEEVEKETELHLRFGRLLTEAEKKEIIEHFRELNLTIDDLLIDHDFDERET